MQITYLRLPAKIHKGNLKSPCLPVSLSPARRALLSRCVCVSGSPRLPVSLSSCLRLPLSPSLSGSLSLWFPGFLALCFLAPWLHGSPSRSCFPASHSPHYSMKEHMSKQSIVFSFLKHNVSKGEEVIRASHPTCRTLARAPKTVSEPEACPAQVNKPGSEWWSPLLLRE